VRSGKGILLMCEDWLDQTVEKLIENHGREVHFSHSGSACCLKTSGTLKIKSTKSSTNCRNQSRFTQFRRLSSYSVMARVKNATEKTTRAKGWERRSEQTRVVCQQQ
jgi:hypothetical protein